LERTLWFLRSSDWVGHSTWPSPVKKYNLKKGEDIRGNGVGGETGLQRMHCKFRKDQDMRMRLEL